ncbi:MAG TPA: hypothetical protein VIC85_19340 [Ktedonobacterales bacterium]|jgi:hypothetical protein
MVEQLRQLFERIERQPEDVQNRIVEMVRLELEDEEAGEWVPTPEERAALEASDAEYAEGLGRSYEDYLRERAAREGQ